MTRRRLANRLDDVAAVERAAPLITDLGADLDRRLLGERRPEHRLRMLRETTNRITRAANDAVQAYLRVSRALRAEAERPGADLEATQVVRARLDAARASVLDALDAARRRYDMATVTPDDGSRLSQ